MIPVGQPAPGFRAPSSKGQTLDAESFLGKMPIVLVFVDDPAAATGQLVLSDLDEHLVDFGHDRVQLLAVVPWSPRQVRERSDRDGMALTMLADESGVIAGAFLGERKSGSAVAVLVGRDGSVAGSYHADESSEFADGLRGRVEALLDPPT